MTRIYLSVLDGIVDRFETKLLNEITLKVKADGPQRTDPSVFFVYPKPEKIVSIDVQQLFSCFQTCAAVLTFT